MPSFKQAKLPQEVDVTAVEPAAPVEISVEATTNPNPFRLKERHGTTTPGPYIRLVVGYPWLVLGMMLALLLPIAYFGVGHFRLSDPEGGQLVRDSYEAEQAHAFQRAAELSRDSFATANGYEPQQTSLVGAGGTYGDGSLKLYYVAGRTGEDDDVRTANVLTVANIQKMAALEDELTRMANWTGVCLRDRGSDTCAPLRSIVPWLRNATSDAELRAAIDVAYDELDGSAGSPLGGTEAAWFFEQGLPHSRYESYIVRSFARLGAPLAPDANESAFVNAGDRRSLQRQRMLDRFLRPAEAVLRRRAEEWKDDAAAASVQLLYAQDWLYTTEYTGIILSDLAFTLGSVCCVYVLLWLYTASAPLALLGLIQILLAFPVTLFVYAVVLRIKLFGVLQAMAIFVILGIGADDVLILTGALLLHEERTAPAAERFAAAFRHAFGAMLTTSVTTAAAFGMTAAIKIPTVRYFAVFCALMVAINFLLCCSLFLAGLVLWDRHLRSCTCTRRRSRLADDEITPRAGLVHRLLQSFVTKVAGFVCDNPRKLVALFGVIAAVMAGFAATLGDPDDVLANPYWSTNHPLGRRWHLEAFALRNVSDGSGAFEVRLVFGIDTINRTGTDPTDDGDLGVTVFDDSFDLGATETQEYLVWLCEDLEAHAADLSLGRLDCFMTALRDWRIARGETFPVMPAHFAGVAREFVRRSAAKDVNNQLGFVLDGASIKLKYAHIKAVTDLHYASPVAVRYDLKQRWLAYVDGISERREKPSTCASIAVVSYTFLLVQINADARGIAWTSVGGSTALAFAVLLIFTLNWRIAALATLTIGCIVSTVVGLVNVYGWKMDTFEAVCITILVGFSVDYTVHLGIAYNDHAAFGDAGDRRARAVRAVSTLGISVCAGAASTAGACLFLFPATILFLPKFGQFMTSAVATAFVYALGFFAALLALVGPVDAQGDLTRVRSLLSRARKSAAPRSPRRATAPCCPPAACAAGFAVAVLLLLGVALLLQLLPEGAAVVSDGAALPPADEYRMPPLDDLEEGVWEEMRPAGATVCSRGTPFVFFVRRGRRDRVAIEFQGGGACWSDETCALSKSTFSENIDGDRKFFAAAADAQRARRNATDAPPLPPVGEGDDLSSGLVDVASEYADWTYIYVPYCTGDLHWGNATVTYAGGVTIEHRGAVNADAAASWMQAALPTPDVLLVAGCSAGAYGSLLWGARLARTYVPRGTRLVQFGDSGVGVVSESFVRDAYPGWNTAAAFPWEIVPAEVAGGRTNDELGTSGLSLLDLYGYAAAAYPTAMWSQYTSAYDENQAFFYEVMVDGNAKRGETTLAQKVGWHQRMRAMYDPSSSALLDGSTPNYAMWVAAGDEHCVIPYDRFWWRRAADGTALSAWLQRMVDGEAVANVDCGGEACLVGVEQ